MRLQPLPGWIKILFVSMALASFFALEQQRPDMAMGLLVLVALTLGMGHGALDAVLLLKQFRPQSSALIFASMYLLLTIGIGWLLSLSFSLALIALIMMSVWHFGEIYSDRMILRLAVGGASVMTPVLLQGNALSQLLLDVTVQDLTLSFHAWTAMAWAWAAITSLVALRAVFSGLTKSHPSDARASAQSRALREIFLVMSLGLVFSPILQFAIYFGLYHCSAHIARVYRAMLRHGDAADGHAFWAWLLSMLITALLLGALWRWLPCSDGVLCNLNSQILQWLVVALAAVTAPHLILVGYSRRWLGL